MNELNLFPRTDLEREDAFGRHVVAHLSAGVHDLDDGLAARLRKGRQRALAAHRPDRTLLHRMYACGRRALLLRPVLRQTVALAAVVVLVGVGDFWSTSAMLAEMTEIDAALLADELPIDAYLDADFSQWLCRDSSS